MVPAVGCSAARMSFEVVVLPQPDSPTRPRVWPRFMVKLTPSTALTQPRLLPSREPPTAKYFLRPRTSSNGSGMFGLLEGQPASDSPAVAQVFLTGLLSPAALQGMPTAGVEATAWRQNRGIWWLPRNSVQRLLTAELWHRVEQCPGVGVPGGIEEVPHWLLLDDLAGIHHRYLVAHFGHNT